MQINISKYIFQFLKANGTIYLSGIGEIKQFHKSAIINEAGIEIVPPLSYFDYQGNAISDQAFIIWLSKMTSCSEAICEESLKQYVQRIQTIIERGNTFHIPLVGSLSFSQGHIKFNGDTWSPYYKYPTLGLSEIPIQEVNASQPRLSGKRLWLLPLFLAIFAIAFIGWRSYQIYNSGLATTDNFHDPKKEGRINQAPVFDSMLTKDSIIESPIESNNDEQTKHESVIPIDSLENTTLESSPEINDFENVESEVIESDNHMSEGVIPQSSLDECIVVVGAFRQASNVDKMFQRLIDDGYSPWKSNHNGLVRVGARSTCAPSDLSALLKSCKMKYDASAWVLE